LERGEYLCGTLGTWLVWKFTKGAVHATDFSCASATGMWDPYIMNWSFFVRLLVSPSPTEYYPPTKMLPTVKNTADDYGVCDSSFFGAPIPINAVASDQAAALFGNACFSSGDIQLSLGTGGFLSVNTGRTCLATAGGIYPLVGWKMRDEICYTLEGVSDPVGLLVDWLIKNKFVSDYSELESNEIHAPHNTDIFFVPAIIGLACPFNDTNARASFFGIDQNTTRIDLVRSVLESFGYRVRQVIEAIKCDTGFQMKNIYVSGGVSQNKFVCQFLANITGKTVIRSPNVETASLGVALFSGLKSGFWSKEDLKKLVRRGTEFRPSMSPEIQKARTSLFDKATQLSMNWKGTTSERPFPILLVLLFVGLGYYVGSRFKQMKNKI